jgi:hypothetical protein
MATNGVHWVTNLALAATLSHFLELGTELELLGSGRNTNMTERQVDALWTRVHQDSDSLVSFVPPLVAHGSPDSTRDRWWWYFCHLCFSFTLM